MDSTLACWGHTWWTIRQVVGTPFVRRVRDARKVGVIWCRLSLLRTNPHLGDDLSLRRRRREECVGFASYEGAGAGLGSRAESLGG